MSYVGIFSYNIIITAVVRQSILSQYHLEFAVLLKNDEDDIKEKYVQEGITIDLAVMYIPSESLMQLIDSIDNLREDLFRDKRVLIMGPNSLAAYLISIHMGFRTLALNERAGDIMQEFGKLKKEFEKFLKK